jgi:hypothetical protein
MPPPSSLHRQPFRVHSPHHDKAFKPNHRLETALAEIWDLVIIRPQLGVFAVVWYCWRTPQAEREAIWDPSK